MSVLVSVLVINAVVCSWNDVLWLEAETRETQETRPTSDPRARFHLDFRKINQKLLPKPSELIRYHFCIHFPRVHLFNLIQYYWLFQLLIENIAVRHNLLLIFNSIPSKSVIFTFHLSYWMPCVRILVSSSTIESIVVQKHLSQRLICPQIVHSVRDLRMNVYDICCLQTLLKYGRKRFF